MSATAATTLRAFVQTTFGGEPINKICMTRSRKEGA